MELRPLGFGEIFDRAVTLYVRNFLAFVRIVVVAVLPLAVFQYIVDVALTPQLQAIMTTLEHPAAKASPAILASLFTSPLTAIST